MLKPIQHLIRTQRRTAPFRLMAGACERYLRAWHNDGFYEFTRNGERFALEVFRSFIGPGPYVVWDVGANQGQWASEARKTLGEVQIVSFELVGPVAAQLQATADPSWHEVRNFGLSDSERQVEVLWNLKDDSTSSLKPRLDDALFQGRLEPVQCQLRTADSVIAEGAKPPVLLKIDVEGGEADVFRGARALIAGPDAPALIQFEYGETWLPFRELLGPTLEFLAAQGYQVGRLFPNHVDFHGYSPRDEHFRMGNYVAARDPKLIAALQN